MNGNSGGLSTRLRWGNVQKKALANKQAHCSCVSEIE